MTSAAATTPTDDTHVTDVTSRLRLAVGRLSRRMRQESSLGHSLTQIGILATLDLAGPTSLGDLAAGERVAPPTITKAVASLVDQGLVERTTDPEDRRVCRAALTIAGRSEVARMRSQRDAWLATRLATVSDADLARLAEVVPVLEALAADGHPLAPPTTR